MGGEIIMKMGVLNDELLEPIIKEMTLLYNVFGRKNYAHRSFMNNSD